MNRFRVLALGSVCLLVSGCGAGDYSGLYDAPLPGGADTGDYPYHVTVQFPDVLDLVPHAAVKVDDVPVGSVDSVDLGDDGWTVQVRLTVNGDVHLPANADAQLVQSSLLGEKYVALSPPAAVKPAGTLADGAVITADRTNRYPEVEEVLGALSLLLNGGGVEQIRTISQEVTKALKGNEGELRGLLSSVDSLVSALDAQRATIVRALDGLDRLATTLKGQRDNLGRALADLGPGLQVLEQQRGQLVGMLQALTSLSGVTVDTVRRSQADLVADLRSLGPTLEQLTKTGQDIPRSLDYLLTFPFNTKSLDSIRGDYTNFTAKLDLDLDSVLPNILGAPRLPVSVLGSPSLPPGSPVLPLPGTAVPSGPSAPPASAPGLGGVLGAILGGL
ncbi:MCE family protein [Amycolatopsis sp. NPDC001319]|uniref:MCE family protein n=1 Tax=unclassified Amycolatopsis TaxID=2618356 RepID=UPI003690B908